MLCLHFRLRFALGWHFSFLALLALLLLLLILERFILLGDRGEALGIDSNQTVQQQQAKEERRSLDEFVGPELGQLVPMREYLDTARLEAVLALANATRAGNSLGVEVSGWTMPGEVDLARLDRDSIARIELRAIVDGIAAESVGMEGVIREWLGQRIELDKEEPGLGRAQANAWDVCLGQANGQCNGHLPSGWHCSCQLVPQQVPAEPPACSKLLSVHSQHLHQLVPANVLSLAVGFPLPALFAAPPPLPDFLLAHWIAHFLLAGRIHWVLMLRKACLSEHLFAVQFAFLQAPASASPSTQEGIRLLPLADVLGAMPRAASAGSWLWRAQALLERAFAVELLELLPEQMASWPFFLANIAKVPSRQCAPPWDYLSLFRCRPQQPLGILVAALLALGLPVGILRFWHQMLRRAEKSAQIGQ